MVVGIYSLYLSIEYTEYHRQIEYIVLEYMCSVVRSAADVPLRRQMLNLLSEIKYKTYYFSKNKNK